jgi:hypothetical protein
MAPTSMPRAQGAIMMRHAIREFLDLLVIAAIALSAAGATAADEATTVSALLRDLKGADFERAVGAAERLAGYPRERARIVAALVAAIRTGQWPRCSGDMRDAIARTLVDLKAKDAVPALLELAASGRTIDHECVE